MAFLLSFWWVTTKHASVLCQQRKAGPTVGMTTRVYGILAGATECMRCCEQYSLLPGQLVSQFIAWERILARSCGNPCANKLISPLIFNHICRIVVLIIFTLRRLYGLNSLLWASFLKYSLPVNDIMLSQFLLTCWYEPTAGFNQSVKALALIFQRRFLFFLTYIFTFEAMVRGSFFVASHNVYTVSLFLIAVLTLLNSPKNRHLS